MTKKQLIADNQILKEDFVRGNIEADKMFQTKKEEAKKDSDLASDLYREYIFSAKTDEERRRRINIFRCG